VFPGVAIAAQQLDVLGVESSFGVFLPVLDVIQMQLSVRSATAHTAAPIEPKGSIPQSSPHPFVFNVGYRDHGLIAFENSIVGERSFDFGGSKPCSDYALISLHCNPGPDGPMLFL
jgi:hypothetical protein